ncbi:MAG: hypothetical protein JST00_31675 [Deltaproteobacteria bacterium]|nr:hypothetical protein [Deltaproteobacteria bacterium]
MKLANYLACAAALADELGAVNAEILRVDTLPRRSDAMGGAICAPQNYLDMLTKEDALQQQLESIMSVGVHNVAESRRLAAITTMVRLLSERVGRLQVLKQLCAAERGATPS